MLSIVCDRATGYQCSNGRCIDLAKFNNSVNDCGDNSDEVSNPCRSPLFSCRNNRCILLDWVLDGNDDCVDQSDEVKRIGTDCSRVTTCCQCQEFVPHSECRHQLCQCVYGYYGNDLGTTCTRRVIGDVCRLAIDCYSAIVNSTCDVNFRCACEVGYYDDSNGTSCSPRSIGDQCSLDSDCAQITNSTCFNGSCRCFPGFRPTGSSGFQCTQRLLSDNCSTDVDCRLVPNSLCAEDNHTCACALGHRPSGDRKSCERRTIGSDCTADVDCRLVPNSHCTEDNQTCACALGHRPYGDRKSCERLTIGSDCSADVDCLTAVPNSVCADRKCRCGLDHVTGPDGSECAAAISMKDRNVAVMWTLIATIVALSAIFAAILFFYAFRCYKLETRLGTDAGHRLPNGSVDPPHP